jgi:hypothetical protein
VGLLTEIKGVQDMLSRYKLAQHRHHEKKKSLETGNHVNSALGVLGVLQPRNDRNEHNHIRQRSVLSNTLTKGLDIQNYMNKNRSNFNKYQPVLNQ